MDYSSVSELEGFIVGIVGDSDARRFRPLIDRLITLYGEYWKISSWLEENEEILGSKDYREYVAALNSLMMNIQRLEDKLDLFRERKPVEESVNPLLKNFERES